MSPVDVLRLRAEARAILWAEDMLDLHQAIDVLQAHAEHSGLVVAIGQDAVQRVLATAFGSSP